MRIYVGAGLPSKLPASRYQGLSTSFDPEAFYDRVGRTIQRSFPNATFFRARGVWRGGSEDSLVVEILEQPSTGSCKRVFARASRVARQLARSLGQDAVMVVATDALGNVLTDFVEAA